jgi:Cu+-exporting ATPase
VDGREVLLGTRALLEDYGIYLDGLADDADAVAEGGATPMFVAIGDQPVGLIAVADTLRPESRAAVDQLEALGLDVWMLTGDNSATAHAIAREAGIDHVLAEVLPHQKADTVRALQAEGRVVAMVGDGINDVLQEEDYPVESVALRRRTLRAARTSTTIATSCADARPRVPR